MKYRLLPATLFLILSVFMSAPLQAKTADDPKSKPKVVSLSASNYSSEVKNGLVFVDFWAAWCGPCRKMAPVLDQLAADYKDLLKVGKVNVDNYKKFSIDMGIQALPTIVVYKDGKEMERITGVVSKDDLVKVVEKYSTK
ncbi:thioredoxin [Dysgonomonas sp. BGC7]|nr:thioredoxin [Dysgonomonas sp. BGC7]